MGTFYTLVSRPLTLAPLTGPDGNAILYILVEDTVPFYGTDFNGDSLANDRYMMTLDASVLRHPVHTPVEGDECEFAYQDATEIAAASLESSRLAVIMDLNSINTITAPETELQTSHCLTGVNCDTPFLFEQSLSQVDDWGYMDSVYDQYYEGVPVVGGRVVVQTDVISGEYEISDNTERNAAISVTPTINESQSVDSAQDDLAPRQAYIDQGQATLVIYPKEDGTFVLAYLVNSAAGPESLSGSTSEVVNAITGDTEAYFIDPNAFPEPDPPPASPAALPSDCYDTNNDSRSGGAYLHRTGPELQWWNGKEKWQPALLFGYSDYYFITKKNPAFKWGEYFKDAEPFVNLQRIWVPGYSNVCLKDPDTCDGELPELFPFAFDNVYKIKDTQFSNRYLERLKNVLQAAADRGHIVELTLFDGWSLDDHYPSTFWKQSDLDKCDQDGCLPASEDSAIPAFYKIFDQDDNLNDLRKAQKKMVDAVLAQVKKITKKKVFIEIMNEARYSNSTQLSDFVKWHQQVTKWVRAYGLLVSANVFDVDDDGKPGPLLSEYSCEIYKHKLDTTKEIDIITLHGKQWKDEITSKLTDIHARFNKPVIIDDDGVGARPNTSVWGWARDVESYSIAHGENNKPSGSAHYNSKANRFDELTTRSNRCKRLTNPALDKGFDDLQKAPSNASADTECPDLGAADAGGLSGPPDDTGTPPPNSPPYTPLPISPANGNWTDATPTLTWTSRVGASSYHFQVRKLAGGATVYEADTGGTSVAVGSGKLSSDTYYKWSVKACNVYGCSGWSVEWTFRVRLFARIGLGSSDNEDGLMLVDAGDGETTVEEITTAASCPGGAVDVELRKNRGESGSGGNDRYMYFNVFDGFNKNGLDGSGKTRRSFKIEVRYWNHMGPGWDDQMCLNYDSTSGAKQAGCVTVTNTGCMKVATFHVTDAYFGNGLASGADIRIKAGDGTPPLPDATST